MSFHLSKSRIVKGDVKEIMTFVYAVNRDKFVSALKSASGLQMSHEQPEADIQNLTNMHNSGGDIKGYWEGTSFTPFNIKDTFSGVHLETDEVRDAIIKRKVNIGV
jgi:hypothetical protein